MSRHFIIDGHNCLMSGGEFFSLPRKDAFVELLKKYSREKELYITLVFDSRSPAGSAYNERVGRLDILYPDYPEEADDLILKIIRRGNPGKDTWVVSSDRKIKDGARRLGLKTMESIDFKNFIREKSEPKQTIENTELNDKPTSSSPGEIEEYLRKFKA